MYIYIIYKIKIIYLLDTSEDKLENEDKGNEFTDVKDNQNDNVISAAEPSKLAPLIAMSRNLPEGTPPERQFPCVHPQLIKMFDMDLIKLTAQYCALNGKKVYFYIFIYYI